MAPCPNCQSPVPQEARVCPACGRELPVAGAAAVAQTHPGFQAPPAYKPQGAGMPLNAQAGQLQDQAGQLQDQARQLQDQAAAAARQAWGRIQSAGPTKVALGLMAGSAVTLFLGSQRGMWGTSFLATAIAVALLVYLGLREFQGKDLLSGRFWWAPQAAVLYLVGWGFTGWGLKVGTLAFLAGALILAYSYLWPLRDWARAWGFDLRYGLYGYRRPMLLGAMLAFVSLLFTWHKASSTGGYFSGGYSYSSYYGKSVWDSMQNFNPGIFFPAEKGIGLGGSMLLEAALVAIAFFACFAPQVAVPKWYRFIPFVGAAYGLFFLYNWWELRLPEPLFLIGMGLIIWGGYQLSIKGVAEGPGDLREIPVQKWLSK
jgi:hypothetical protein